MRERIKKNEERIGRNRNREGKQTFLNCKTDREIDKASYRNRCRDFLTTEVQFLAPEHQGPDNFR